MALLVMALAVASLPYPGYLLLISAAIVGLIIGAWRIRRADVAASPPHISAPSGGHGPQAPTRARDATLPSPRADVPDDEDDRTNKVQAWLFLIGLILIASAARGLYSSQGAIPSSRFELLERLGLITFLWYWLTTQCRPYRASFPLDLAFFLTGLWFIMLPYYLWHYERWRGLLKCLAIGTAYLVGRFLSLGMHYAIV